MPYAAYNKISTSPLPGGVSITESQYGEALACMTSKANPKKVSVANGFQMVAPSSVEPIVLMEAITLPSLGTRNPVCTGLARHPSGNGWLVGDDGRTVTGTTTDGGVIWYNDDFSAVLANFKTIGNFGLTNQHSIQGVCAIPGSNEFWCVARRIPNTGNSTVIKADATTGAVLQSSLCQNTANGIALVPEQGWFYTLQTTGEITKWFISGGAHDTSTAIVDMNSTDTNDHLLYLGNGKMLMNYGANGANGTIVTCNVSGTNPVAVKSTTIVGANAIEGICIHDGFLWVCNDGEYHGSSPALNRILKYSIGSLLD